MGTVAHMHWPQPSGSPAMVFAVACGGHGVRSRQAYPRPLNRSLFPRFAACSATSRFCLYRHCMPMQWLGGQTSAEPLAANVLGVCLRSMAPNGTHGTHTDLLSLCKPYLARALTRRARNCFQFLRRLCLPLRACPKTRAARPRERVGCEARFSRFLDQCRRRFGVPACAWTNSATTRLPRASTCADRRDCSAWVLSVYAYQQPLFRRLTDKVAIDSRFGCKAHKRSGRSDMPHQGLVASGSGCHSESGGNSLILLSQNGA